MTSKTSAKDSDKSTSKANKVPPENTYSKDISSSTSATSSPSTNKKESFSPLKSNSTKISWNKKTKATPIKSHKTTPPPLSSSVSTSKTIPTFYKPSKTKLKMISKTGKLLSLQWYLPKSSLPSKPFKLRFLTPDPKFSSIKTSLEKFSPLMTSSSKLRKWNFRYLKCRRKISSDAFLKSTRFPLHTASFSLSRH